VISDIIQPLQATARRRPASLIDLPYSIAVKRLTETKDFEAFFHQYTEEYIPTGPNWKPYLVNCKEELKHLFATHRVFVTTEEAQGESCSSQKSVKIGALSYCSNLRIGDKCRLDIYYYGDVTNLSTHVSAQLLHVSAVWSHRVGIALHFVSSIGFDDVDRLPSILGEATDKVLPFQMHKDAYMLARKLFL